MKIEKISDNQIRCTLTKDDLLDRQLKLSELAYGSEKAKSLFQDMMQQASFEFGFEVDNTPLVIEASPAAKDSIVLTITKVNDPDELDEKFSSMPTSEELHNQLVSLEKLEGAEDLLDLLKKIKEAMGEKIPSSAKEEDDGLPDLGVRLFSFSNLEQVIEASTLFQDMYDGSSTLYKDTDDGVYILAITQAKQSISTFNRICNMMSEYGSLERASGATLAYLEEHCETILDNQAMKTLAQVN